MKLKAAWITPLLVGVLLSTAAPARAQQYRVFTNPADFSTAAGPDLTCRDFEELVDWEHTAAVTYPGVTFHSVENDPSDLTALSPESLSFPALTSRVLACDRNFNPVIAELDPQVTAVSLDVLSLPGGPGVVVTVDGTEGSQSFPVSFSEGGPAFFGVIADSGRILRVTVSNPEGVSQFVAVDNVCYGDAPVADPLGEALDALSDEVAAGRADGTIRGLGSSLENKIAGIRAAVEAEDAGAALDGLRGLYNQVRAQRGKKIHAARADRLLVLIEECAALL